MGIHRFRQSHHALKHLSSPHHINIPQRLPYSNPRLTVPTILNDRPDRSNSINPPNHHYHCLPEHTTTHHHQQLIPPPQRPPYIPLICQQDFPIFFLPCLHRDPLRIHLRLDPSTPRLHPPFPHRGQIRSRNRSPWTMAASLSTFPAEGACTVQRNEI